MESKTVDLKSINSGAAIDLFQNEFKKVLENIADPNVKPDAVREIRLVIKIKPDKNLSAALTTVQVTSKLAPVNPHESVVLFGFDGEKVSAYVSDSKQDDLPGIKDENIIEMKGVK